MRGEEARQNSNLGRLGRFEMSFSGKEKVWNREAVRRTSVSRRDKAGLVVLMGGLFVGGGLSCLPGV